MVDWIGVLVGLLVRGSYYTEDGLLLEKGIAMILYKYR